MRDTLRAVLVDEPVKYGDVLSLLDRMSTLRSEDRISDTALLLEHDPVITLGRSARKEHVIADADSLASNGISVHESPRGGDVTLHAPGQLVIYPVLALNDSERDVHKYVEKLEEIAIRTAGDFGIEAFRKRGAPGAWTERGKLSAVGVKIRRWITSHGLSINVDIDLTQYDLIVPCGLTNEKVTSMRDLLDNTCPSLSEVRNRAAGHLADILHRETTLVRMDRLSEAAIQ